MATSLLIDDTDPTIVYAGDWQRSGNPGEYMGTTTVTMHKGDTARLTFPGEVLHFLSGVDH